MQIPFIVYLRHATNMCLTIILPLFCTTFLLCNDFCTNNILLEWAIAPKANTQAHLGRFLQQVINIINSMYYCCGASEPEASERSSSLICAVGSKKQIFSVAWNCGRAHLYAQFFINPSHLTTHARLKLTTKPRSHQYF